MTERAMRGELEFCDALRARVALLKGLPVSVFDAVHDKLHFTKGALELIDTLHAHGWKVGVVSGGTSRLRAASRNSWSWALSRGCPMNPSSTCGRSSSSLTGSLPIGCEDTMRNDSSLAPVLDVP